MYEDIVNSLRHCAENDCSPECPRSGIGKGCISGLKREAADAIEELSKQLHEMGQAGKFLLDVHKINSKNVKTGVIHYPTNADRIRDMTDEGLAEFMCHNVSNGTVNCAFCAAAEFCRMGHNGWLDWLKQEAKDDEQS